MGRALSREVFVAEGTVAGLKPDPGYGAERKWQKLWRSMPEHICCLIFSSFFEPSCKQGHEGRVGEGKSEESNAMTLFPLSVPKSTP